MQGKQKGADSGLEIDIFRERECLLSNITGDPTDGIRRAKKQSCSTWRGLRVDSSFKEFRQTPRCKGFFLLGFYTLFKCIYDA